MPTPTSPTHGAADLPSLCRPLSRTQREAVENWEDAYEDYRPMVEGVEAAIRFARELDTKAGHNLADHLEVALHNADVTAANVLASRHDYDTAREMLEAPVVMLAEVQ